MAPVSGGKREHLSALFNEPWWPKAHRFSSENAVWDCEVPLRVGHEMRYKAQILILIPATPFIAMAIR